MAQFRRFLVALALASIFLGFANFGCREKPVRIGVVLELSGDASVYGQSILKAVELAIDDVNQQGGIRGHPLIAIVRDAESDPNKGLQAVRSLVEEDRIRIIIGAATSTVTLAIGQYCQKRGVVLLSPAASSPQITFLGDYIFRNFPSDRLEGRMMALYLREKFHIPSVAVIYLNNDYGRDLQKVFVSEFRRLGGRITATFEYTPGTTDFSPIIKQLNPNSFHAVYLIGYFPDLVELISTLRDTIDPKWIFSVSAIATPGALKARNGTLEGVIFLQPAYDPNGRDPRVQKFVKKYKETYGETPDIYAAHGYDAVMILAQNMRLFGTSPEEVQFGLFRTHGYKGVAGVTTFNDDGDVLRFPRLYIIQQGRFVPLDDARLKTLLGLKAP